MGAQKAAVNVTAAGQRPVMVYAGGPISGGMYNPAVALGCLLRNTGTKLSPALEPAKFAAYVLTQLFAACVAGGCASWILEGHGNIGHPAIGDKNNDADALLGEVIGTCLLVLVVLSTATVAATKDNSYFGLAIGFSVVVMAYAVGGASGGAFNPAVGMLNYVASKDESDSWVYWVGPFVGAAIATALFKVIYKKDLDAEENAPPTRADELKKPLSPGDAGYSTLA